MRDGGVEVRRLVVHGDQESLRLRLGVAQVLGATDLVGTRLPPAAVLVVRSLRDPLPGRLDVRRPGPDREWERQVRGVLDDLVLRAARPASGEPDPGAPAVLFTDRAEMLACVWRELRHHGRATSWWWRALRLDDVERLVASLREEPAQVLAVLAALDASRGLDDCLAVISDSAAASIAAVVAEAFGRPALVAEVGTRLADAAASPVVDRPGRPLRRTTTVAGAPDPPAPVPAGRSRAKAVLAEVCRIVGPPATSRSWPDPPAAPTGDRRSPRRTASPTDGGRPPAPVREEAPRRSVGPPPTGPPGRVVRSRSSPAARRQPSRDRRLRADGPPVDLGGPEPARGRSGDGRPDAARLEGARSAGSPQAPPVTSAGVVATSLGGLFHVVQVGQALGLYADFTSPAGPGLRLGLWDFVTLLGRGIGVGLRRDPVWRLLADLEGRDPTRPPGTGFRAPRAWRAPTAWLTPVDAEGPWRWRDDGRLRTLVHPTGFVVVEGPQLDRDRECARHRVARCVDVPVRPGAGADGPATARDRWIAHLSGYVRVRLAAALGVPPARAGRLLCRRPAEVHVTATRIDVVSALADLPIEVRLAGLDRDLGFVPAAGLAIGFGFR